VKVVIKDGVLQMIAPDDLSFLSRLGHVSVRRASHVEPISTESGTQWTADLSPVGGPLLGPFPRRSEALSSETAWLEERLGDIIFRKE